jgi:crotonobetainyl-CoA:carnitine CoA-transferase CaiB-like acyl-CoA transferase
MARNIIRAFKLNEISAVDRPAQFHATMAILKRDDAASKSFNAHGKGPAHDHLWALYDNAKRGSPELTSTANFAAAWNQLSDAERDEIRDEEAVVAAALQAEKDRLVAELSKREKRMTRTEIVADLAKRGVRAIAKAAVDSGEAPELTEHEFTRLIKAEAQQGRRAGETPEQAFVRFFSDPDNREIRVAHQMTKRLPNYCVGA